MKQNKSIAHLQEAIEINPNFYEAYNLIADIILDSGDYLEAESWYNKSINIMNKKISKLEQNIDKSLEMNLFKEVKTLQSKISDTLKDISYVYHKMGLISIQNNNNELAVKRFKESIQTDKDNAESYFQLSKLTKGKKSTSYLNQAIEIDPEFSIQ